MTYAEQDESLGNTGVNTDAALYSVVLVNMNLLKNRASSDLTGHKSMFSKT